MKKIIYLFVISTLAVSTIQAQNVEANLAQAKASYKSGNLEDARFALQQALSEVETVIGKEVLKILPVKMGSFAFVEADDNVLGMSGSFAGLNVTRNYGGGEGQGSASVSIMSDSPLLAGINAILALPAMLGGSDPNQKRIKIDGYKGLLQKNEAMEGSPVSYEVQVPFGSSLLTFHCEGVNNETEVLSMANTIPVSKIVELTK